MAACVVGINTQKVAFFSGLAFLVGGAFPLVRFYLSRRNRKDKDEDNKGEWHDANPRPTAFSLSLPVVISLALLWISGGTLDLLLPAELPARIPGEWGCREVEHMPLVGQAGQGFFAAVFETEYGGQPFALKVSNPRYPQFDTGSGREFLRESFLWEARLLRALQANQHIIRFYGACGERLVLEFLPKSLESYMKEFPDANPPFQIKLNIALAIARAVNSLHSASVGQILHLDVRPEQFLFDENGILKLADLNRARLLRGGLEGTCRSAIVGRYKSPEELRGALVTTKSDVYSVGMTFYYVLTGQSPFWSLTLGQVRQLVLEGNRPPIPEDTHPKFRQILMACWADNPMDRPDAALVVQALNEMVFETETANLGMIDLPDHLKK